MAACCADAAPEACCPHCWNGWSKTLLPLALAPPLAAPNAANGLVSLVLLPSPPKAANGFESLLPLPPKEANGLVSLVLLLPLLPNEANGLVSLVLLLAPPANAAKGLGSPPLLPPLSTPLSKPAENEAKGSKLRSRETRELAPRSGFDPRATHSSSCCM